MEEYNLDNDANSYAGAVGAYQSSMMREALDQQAAKKKADDAHDEWATPVDVVGAELIAKPVKTFLKAAAKKVIKKGIKTGGKIVAERLEDARTRLTDIANNTKLPTGSTIEDARNGLQRTQGEAQASLRNSVNRLRRMRGQDPIAETPATDPAPATPNQAPQADAPDTVPQTRTNATDEGQVDSIADNQPIDTESINSWNDLKSASNQLKDKFNALSPQDQAEVRTRFSDDPNTVDVPSIRADGGDVGSAFKTNLKQMQDHIQNVSQGVPNASQDTGSPDVDFTDKDAGLQTPQNLSTDINSTGQLESNIQGTTSQEVAGSNDADVVGDFMGGMEQGGADIAEKVAGTAGETLADIAGAGAAAEGGLNPFMDLLALGAGIASLFGASKKPKVKPVAYQAVNPSIEHGI